MDNSIYIALSRQLAQFRDLETTASNLANVNTTGFQAKKTLFSDHLTDAGNNYKAAYLHDVSTYRDLRGGAFKVTGNPLDVAIQGPGYFAISTAGGTRYTRDGGFTQNQEGELITSSGNLVQDDAGQPILIPVEARDISIRDNGAVVVDGDEIAQIGLFEFNNDHSLVAEGDNLLRPTTDPALPAVASTIKHGVLEGSNVQPVTELTHLTTLSKSVKNTAELVEVMYELQRRAGRTWLSQQNG
jgi:flagellar basal-body rod protein FlgF